MLALIPIAHSKANFQLVNRARCKASARPGRLVRRVGHLVRFVLTRRIGERHGAIGGKQDAQRPGYRLPAAPEHRVQTGSKPEHGAHPNTARLRKVLRLAPELIEQIERLARAQRVDIERIKPRAQGIDQFFVALGRSGEQWQIAEAGS